MAKCLNAMMDFQLHQLVTKSDDTQEIISYMANYLSDRPREFKDGVLMFSADE